MKLRREKRKPAKLSLTPPTVPLKLLVVYAVGVSHSVEDYWFNRLRTVPGKPWEKVDPGKS